VASWYERRKKGYRLRHGSDLATVGTPHFAQFVPLGNLEVGFFTVYDGSFDTYIWSFVGHEPKQNRWKSMQDVPARQRESFAYASAGAIVQNVYLYCASVGLAVGARGWMNRTALAANLKLPVGSSPLLAQTVVHFAHAHQSPRMVALEPL